MSAGISQNLLRWKGIEATQALATSTNSKVVVIGAGADGLPLGLQLVTGAFQEETLFRAASALEAAADFHARPDAWWQ